MKTTEKFAAALVLLAPMLAAPLHARADAPFTVEETGDAFATLQDAVDSIGGGEGVIRIAPGRYEDCAVQEEGRVAYVAEARGTAVFDAGICEGKATLVLRGRSARVEGLVFTHTEVDDGNGAGIRIEKGDLKVSYTSFIDAQSGILSAEDTQSSIIIDHSTFAGLGKDPTGNGAHSVYVGHYGSLTVTASRFERGTGGHYLKSRSPRIEVTGSSFDDSQGSHTNYLIDLPEGARGRIASNTFVNGRGKDNYSSMITVAPEDRLHPSEGLVIEGNDVSVAPGFRWTTTFVTDWSGEPLVIRNNRLASGIRLFNQR